MASRRPRKGRGFGEVQAGFAGSVLPGAIFSAYGYKCAFTGRSLAREAEIDPYGWLLRLTLPGVPASPADFIPAITDAIHAYERGHLALGTRYNFLVDLETISPEFLEMLNPIGRLTLPADERYYPSPTALALHREAFAAGRIE